MPKELVIAMVCIIAISMVVLTFVFLQNIRREKDKLAEEKIISEDNVLTYEMFIKFLTNRIKSSKNKKYFTVFWIEIDNFIEVIENYSEKDVNDFLDQICLNIKSVMPRNIKLGYGPRKDSILLYLSELYPEEQMSLISQQLKQAAEVKIRIFQDMVVSKTSTISYATYPLHGEDASTLIEALRTAVYLGENSGGNIIKPYTKDMSKDKIFIEKYYELKQAIQKREFYFVYQPIVKLETKEIVGFESLLRWQHPTKGSISPHQFIKELENSGDINWIGTWGLETLVKTMTEFKREDSKDYMWHLNISLRQLLNQKVVNEFQRIVTKYRVEARTIVLELNDFGTQDLHDETIKTLLKLKNIGFKLAVDILDVDFQMANKIETYKIDIAKINKSFYIIPEEITKNKFIDVLKELQQKKKLIVIAEVIENTQMEQDAIKNHFNYAQGYHYYPPLSKIDALDLIKEKI